MDYSSAKQLLDAAREGITVVFQNNESIAITRDSDIKISYHVHTEEHQPEFDESLYNIVNITPMSKETNYFVADVK